MGGSHAHFSPSSCSVDCSGGTYYSYVSHKDTSGDDARDSSPETIVSGYSPDGAFSVTRDWESLIGEDWTNKEIIFKGYFFGTVTFRHRSAYDYFRHLKWRSSVEYPSVVFDIWPAKHSCVEYQRYWRPCDKVISITFKASSAEELESIKSERINISNIEPKNNAELREWRWEDVDEKSSVLKIDIDYNLSRRYPKIVKISAGKINLCTIYQKPNTSWILNTVGDKVVDYKSAGGEVEPPENNSFENAVHMGKGFITAKVGSGFEFLEKRVKLDYPANIVHEQNDIDGISHSVSSIYCSFSFNLSAGYSNLYFYFSDSSGNVVRVNAFNRNQEGEYVRGGTNTHHKRSFMILGFLKENKVESASVESAYYREYTDDGRYIENNADALDFIRNPYFVATGRSGNNYVYEYRFDGTMFSRGLNRKIECSITYRLEKTDGTFDYVIHKFSPTAFKTAGDAFELTDVLVGDGDADFVKDHDSARINSSGGIEILNGSFGSIKPEFSLKSNGMKILGGSKTISYESIPNTFREISDVELDEAYAPGVLIPISGIEYDFSSSLEFDGGEGVVYNIAGKNKCSGKLKIVPRFSDFSTSVDPDSVKIGVYSPRKGWTYENDARDGSFFAFGKYENESMLYSYTAKKNEDGSVDLDIDFFFAGASSDDGDAKARFCVKYEEESQGGGMMPVESLSAFSFDYKQKKSSGTSIFSSSGEKINGMILGKENWTTYPDGSSEFIFSSFNDNAVGYYAVFSIYKQALKEYEKKISPVSITDGAGEFILKFNEYESKSYTYCEVSVYPEYGEEESEYVKETESFTIKFK